MTKHTAHELAALAEQGMTLTDQEAAAVSAARKGQGMSTTDDGGPAFPFAATDGSNVHMQAAGMTLRQYAAITLCVPNSGTPWLDDMIQKALVRDIAVRAMQGAAADSSTSYSSTKYAADDAYEMAHAMLTTHKVQS